MKSIAVILSLAGVLLGLAAAVPAPPSLASASTGHMTPCVFYSRIMWVKPGQTCPSGTTTIPNACDEGWCVESCLPECDGVETVDAIMCCEQVSGDADCFQVVWTTAECPPGHDLLYCEHGIEYSDGSEECFFD